MALTKTTTLLLLLGCLLLLAAPTHAFGAGNIASISKVEGKNWRHGDIEDTLKLVACLKHHKWSSMMIKRVYFGNWLRDYSQAVDVGTLKGVQKDTIRILVWVLAFMGFGYATGEFEVTEERLGVYRPEEHIDNPRDYADNEDARKYDLRLRGPVSREELAVDPNTGMKNYIANEYGGWATSSGYVKHSLTRAIHFGRVYTNGGHGAKGKEEDLCEALRCLGQALHCLEDFGAHTNYTELALRELGFNGVFPHTGTNTQINLHGKHVFPLVTGTFGGVDFLHSVLGEATDHFTQADIEQSEIDEMNAALGQAAGGGGGGKRGSSSGTSNSGGVNGLIDLLGKVPGTGSLCTEAQQLQRMSDDQAAQNHSGQYGSRGVDDYSSTRASSNAPQQYGQQSFAAPPGSQGGPPGPGIPGMNPNFDPQSIVPKIYPILAFRDKVVRAISSVISKIPGLESLIDKITERVTIFVFSLLAPFIQPIIAAASASLKQGSSAVVDASGRHQYEPWTDPNCTDPTHSLLSKDHFSNILNEPAGRLASAILQYVAPRVIYAMDNPSVPVQQVLDDVVRVFHHPAARDMNNEIHRNMFATVEKWVHERSDRGHGLNDILGSQSVREGKNHIGGVNPHTAPGGGAPHSHGQGSTGGAAGIAGGIFPGGFPGAGYFGSSSGAGGGGSGASPFSRIFSADKRDLDFDASGPGSSSSNYQQPPEQHYYASDPSYSHQPGGYSNEQYNQQYNQPGSAGSGAYGQGADAYQHATQPAGQVQGDSYAYPTAYQQGYEVPYGDQQGQQQQQQQGGGGGTGEWGQGKGGAYGSAGGGGGGYGGTGY
ncbi:Het-C-domain-containing protein [Aulographum hederae CBS 113979]|uniref:Het-C-domain-containing protein n=1 Tax=Aulographum hederae CBS 113979 TaxID=1176131 RepID=A0A6G1GQF5_9PEZI|nr:Het-C-domain-containing protein [Aulographum hederae CBS 113979]